jgi:hypothetical protein
MTGAICCQRAVKNLLPEMRFVSGDGAQFSMVHCRGIFALIGVQVCDERTGKM